MSQGCPPSCPGTCDVHSSYSLRWI
jgi:hypothetical protein